MNISIILSAGSGGRFGSETPKQYALLLGREVISYSVSALKNASLNDLTIIVSGEGSIERLTTLYGAICIRGGASRNASVKRGIDYIQTNYPECRNLFIAEAARPFLTADLVDLYFQYLDTYDAVITAQHITDSLGKLGEYVTPRDMYYLIQAPEAFRFALLSKYFCAESDITATVQQLPENSNVMRYFDFKNNLKITYREDLQIAEQLMKLRND